MQDRMQAARELARTHRVVDHDVRHVFLLEPSSESALGLRGFNEPPIALLEVVDGAYERGIEPIGFSADPERGVPFPVLIVQVSPREYERIEQGQFDMQGWRIGVSLLSEEPVEV